MYRSRKAGVQRICHFSLVIESSQIQVVKWPMTNGK